MGDINQLTFIRKFVDQLHGPYLEVGSKDYGSTQDLRALFASRDRYLGVDREDGPGVDLRLDLTDDFETIDEQLDGLRFGTIFCQSVLEHCRAPLAMAENLTRLLRPGGSVCISVPLAWKIHAYPADYWRFTPEGVRVLFPRLQFEPDRCTAATDRPGDFRPLDRDVGRIPLSSKTHRRQGHPWRGISAKLLSGLAKLGILTWLAGYPYVLAPTNLLMIGTLPESTRPERCGG